MKLNKINFIYNRGATRQYTNPSQVLKKIPNSPLTRLFKFQTRPISGGYLKKPAPLSSLHET